MPRVLLYNATLLERRDLSPTLAIFRIRPDQIPPPEEHWFEAGQYVSLGLNDEASPEPFSVQRAYSIASEPEERGWLEFYVRWVAHPESAHPFTHLLWQRRPADLIHVGRRCTGRFTLAHTAGREDPRIKLFVAAGTGLAPFMSIVRSQLRRLPSRGAGRFVVLHGASHVYELGYGEELAQALKELQGDYIPMVSRPRENPSWTGGTGRVESFLEGEKLEALERRLGLAEGGFVAANAVVFVCGFKGTIAESLVRLVRRGFVPGDRRIRRLLDVAEGTPASVFFEQYDNEPVIDPKDEPLIERLRADLAATRAVQGQPHRET